MKSFILLVFIFLFSIFQSCKTLSIQDIYGSYVGLKNQSKSFTFYKSSFNLRDTVLNHSFRINDDCCDTISYGSWELLANSNFISLVSSIDLGDPSLNKIKFNVSEFENKESDSLIIEIKNPLERDSFDADYDKILDYEVLVIKKSESFLFQEPKNNLVIFRNQEEPLKEIKCYIQTNNRFRGRNIGVRIVELDYLVKSPKSNSFIINIPDLTYEYLTYLRFKREFVRVIDKNHLEWQGEIYVRKKKGA